MAEARSGEDSFEIKDLPKQLEDHHILEEDTPKAERTAQIRRLIEDVLQRAVLDYVVHDMGYESSNDPKANAPLMQFSLAELAKKADGQKKETVSIKSLSDACRQAMDKTAFDNGKNNIVRETIDEVIRLHEDELMTIGHNAKLLKPFVEKYFNISAMVKMIISSMEDVTHLTLRTMELLMNYPKGF